MIRLVNVFTRAGDHCDEMLSRVPSLAWSTLTRQVMKCISSTVACCLPTGTIYISLIRGVTCCLLLCHSNIDMQGKQGNFRNILGEKKKHEHFTVRYLNFLTWHLYFDSKFYIYSDESFTYCDLFFGNLPTCPVKLVKL